MDAVIFIAICLVLVLRTSNTVEESDIGSSQEIVSEDTTNRVAKLNENFYDDPEAFMDIAHALGFPREK